MDANARRQRHHFSRLGRPCAGTYGRLSTASPSRSRTQRSRQRVLRQRSLQRWLHGRPHCVERLSNLARSRCDASMPARLIWALLIVSSRAAIRVAPASVPRARMPNSLVLRVCCRAPRLGRLATGRPAAPAGSGGTHRRPPTKASQARLICTPDSAHGLAPPSHLLPTSSQRQTAGPGHRGGKYTR